MSETPVPAHSRCRLALFLSWQEETQQIVDHRQLVSVRVIDKALLKEIIRDLWGVDEEQTVSYDISIYQVALKQVLDH